MYLKDGSLISIDVGVLSKDITEYTINLKKQFLNKIVMCVMDYFNRCGFYAKDCTPWDREFLSFGDCVFYKVKDINKVTSNIHLAIEFNNSIYKGIKCFVGENSFREEKIAKNIINSFIGLGFLDLGVLYSDVYKITNTTMPCIIVRINYNILDIERDEKFLIPSLSKKLVNSIVSLGTM